MSESKTAYIATRRIKHNGVAYESGDPIELEEKWAEPLRKCRAIKPDDRPKEPKVELVDTEVAPDALAAITEGLQSLNLGDGTGEPNQPITAELGTPTNLPPEPEQQPEQQPQEDSANLSAMTVEKLKALAAERGIELPAKALKAEIIELLSK